MISIILSVEDPVVNKHNLYVCDTHVMCFFLTLCVCVYRIRTVKPEPIYKSIGEVIRSLRRRADKAQKALASQLGISRATLANIETGRQRILVHQLYAIAQALDVRLMDLLPSPRDVVSPENWTTLSFDGDLNTEQKKQVAHLIGQVETAAPQHTEKTNAKGPATRRNTRSSRTKIAR
jgi:transcriptional regulator with XRE-family HTH domain